ncbi:MAG: M17 family peptidase N-terminal domain-containing protein, partial [Cyanobacteriota bacterium]|nr:M17 family peptidase N-terminal domain-containing protein [Cyanobacteriota bacterium]
MQIQAVSTTQLDWTGEALALGLFEGITDVTGDLATLDEKLDGTIREAIASEEFTGKTGSLLTTRLGTNSPIRKLILVGLGQAEDWKLDGLRSSAAAIARAAKQQKVKTLGISLPLVQEAATASAIAEGLLLALHLDNRFKSDSEETEVKLETIELLGLGDQKAALDKAQAVCSGIILARELVAAPANAVTPITLAETARELAGDYSLDLEILEQEDCEKLGMGAYLG